MRRASRIVAWVPLIWSAAVLVLLSCAPAAPKQGGAAQAPEASPAAQQRTLVLAVRTEPPSLADKPLVSSTPVLDAVPLFNAELDRKDERGQSFPYLAEELPRVGSDSWRTLPDGRMETTYRLKPNLTWHDATPLTSDDFVFAWQVYATTEFGMARSLPVEPMEEVVPVDARTFTIRWKRVYADADQLGTDFPPLPKHILQKDFDNLDVTTFPTLAYWSAEYVGVGPFRLTRWEPGAFIEGDAFDGFVLGRPKVDHIEARLIPDANTAIAGLLTGAVHYVGQYVLSPDNIPGLESQWGDQGVIQYSPVDLRGGWIQQRPEFASPPALMDVRVRRALAHALDKAGANEALYFGRGILADTCLSPVAPNYDQIGPGLQKYPYDLRTSQQLMEQAGFTKGADGFYADRDGASFEVGAFDLGSTQNDHENAAVVDGLRKAGFNAQMNVLAASVTRDLEAQAKLPGIFVQGCGATVNRLPQFTTEQIARPENRYAGLNRMAWSNTDYDRAYQAFTQTLDTGERVRRVAEMHKLVSENLPVTPYWLRPVITAHTKALTGPVARQTGDVQYAVLGVWQWEWTQ